MKVRELIHKLEAAEWVLRSTRGSHRQFKYPQKASVVTVAGHPGKDVPTIWKETGAMKYTVIYEKGESTWGAYVPDLPGVIAAGDSREEVETLIREAVEFHIEGLRAEGLAIPPPASWAGALDVVTA